MKLDKEDLNGHWFKANKETFDALVKAGYECIEDSEYTGAEKQRKYHVDNRGFATCLKTNYKQAYYHNGEFFTRNEKGEIRGLWITDVPLEEQAYIDASEIVNTPFEDSTIEGFLKEKRNYLADNNTQGNSWWYSWGDWLKPKGHKITWGEFIELFGKDELRERWLKKPELIDVDLPAKGKTAPKDEPELTYEEQSGVAQSEEHWFKAVRYCEVNGLTPFDSKNWAKALAETSLKDKHAKIKAEYEAAKEAEANGGPIVKFFTRPFPSHKWQEIPFETFLKEPVYHSDKKPENIELRYYEVAFEKVLETSYRDSEFVECEFSNDNFHWFYATLRGASPNWGFVTGSAKTYKYCRIPKGTEIKEEWLKEIKKDGITNNTIN